MNEFILLLVKLQLLPLFYKNGSKFASWSLQWWPRELAEGKCMRGSVKNRNETWLLVMAWSWCSQGSIVRTRLMYTDSRSKSRFGLINNCVPPDQSQAQPYFLDPLIFFISFYFFRISNKYFPTFSITFTAVKCSAV